MYIIKTHCFRYDSPQERLLYAPTPVEEVTEYVPIDQPPTYMISVPSVAAEEIAVEPYPEEGKPNYATLETPNSQYTNSYNDTYVQNSPQTYSIIQGSTSRDGTPPNICTNEVLYRDCIMPSGNAPSRTAQQLLYVNHEGYNQTNIGQMSSYSGSNSNYQYVTNGNEVMTFSNPNSNIGIAQNTEVQMNNFGYASTSTWNQVGEYDGKNNNK